MNHPSITHDSPSIVLHAAAHTLTALAALTPHGPRDVGSTAQVRFVDLIKEASASTSVKPDDPFSDITCNGVPLAKFKKCVSGAAAVWWCVCVWGGGAYWSLPDPAATLPYLFSPRQCGVSWPTALAVAGWCADCAVTVL